MPSWCFMIWVLMAPVALLVLGILNLSCSVISASCPVPVLNLKVMMSGFFFLAVILRMYSKGYLYLTRPHPALSESSRSTISLSEESRMWLQSAECSDRARQRLVLYCIECKNWTMNRLNKSAQIEMLNTHTNNHTVVIMNKKSTLYRV